MVYRKPQSYLTFRLGIAFCCRVFCRAFWVVLALLLLTPGTDSMGAGQVAPVLDPQTPPAAPVVVVKHPSATRTFEPQLGPLRKMIHLGLSRLWSTSDVAAAWQTRLAPSDVVGIRVHSAPGKTGGTRPAVVAALIESLLDSGFPARNIIVWDRHQETLRSAGFEDLGVTYGVRIRAARQSGYTSDAFYESSLIGTMVWGDREFGQQGEGVGKRSFVTQLLTNEITKIINVSPLLNHNYVGTSGNLYGLAMASVDNTFRFEADRRKLAIAVPEIVAVPEVGDRVILNVVDALIAQYQGQTQARLQDSAVLNELRFSPDPVALDLLSIQDLEALREQRGLASLNVNRTLYENASLLRLGSSKLEDLRIQRVSARDPY